MKFIILVSNLKEISPSVFSWKKKEYIKNYDAILLSKYDSSEKRYYIMLTVYVLKNGVGRHNIFFLIFTQSLLNPPFCVVFVYNLSMFWFVPCAFFFQQTISYMRKRFKEWGRCVGRMNIARVNIEILLDTRKSNSDVFPSFQAIYVWYYEKLQLHLV